MSSADTSSRRLPYQPALDGLRAVAVAGVVLFHAFAASDLTGWLRGGNLGVSVFFTLSGFLIASLLLLESEGTARVDLVRFFGRRVQRLVPAALVVVVAVMVLHGLGLLSTRSSDVAAAVWSVTNWHIIVGGEASLLATVLGPFGPTWSLAVEEQAYLVLAVLAWVGCRTGRIRAVLAAGATAAILLSLAVALTAGDWSPRVEFGTDARGGEIAVGVVLALVVRRSPTVVDRHRRLLVPLGSVAAATLLALFAVADYDPPWLLRGGFLVVAACSSLVIAAALTDTPVRRLLAAGPVVAVGRASYALYLVHWPVYLVLDAQRLGLSGVALVGVRLVAAGVAAAALHLVVEQPMRRRTMTPRVAIGGWLAASLTLGATALLLIG